MEKLLSIKDLQVTFSSEKGVTEAVRSVSFDLNRGEILGIAGESGSGKSVTALSIMRLLPTQSKKNTQGKLTFYYKNGDTQNLNTYKPSQINGLRGQKIGMIFQEPMSSLNPVMSCGEQVSEVFYRHTRLPAYEVKEKVLALFARVRLQDPKRIFQAYPHQLSGGQKQRVMIAQAICLEPDLLIADEPTTALDVTVQRTVLDLLKDLQAETGMAVLFISHDLGVLKYLCQRILIMRAGEIVERGSSEEIFQEPKHLYTKALLNARPPIDKKLRRLPELNDNFEKRKSISDAVQSSNKDKDGKSRIFGQNSILCVENLSVKFPKEKSFFGGIKSWLKAVNQVSLEVKQGEILGLVGESGSGKTTLGRAILHLQEFQEGSIYFQGNKVIPNQSFRQKVQIIFQDPQSSLNPRRPIGTAITEVLDLYSSKKSSNEKNEIAMNLLKKVGLDSAHFVRYPHEFSGGQKQRICIARALAAEPQLLVCDESVSALDVSVQAQVLNLLKSLRDEFNLSMIFISHDLSVIRFMCDRIAVMHEGKIVEKGEAETFFEQPKTEYAKKLLSAIL